MKKAIVTIVALLSIALGALILAWQTDPVQRAMGRYLGDALDIEIERVSLHLPFTLTAHNVQAPGIGTAEKVRAKILPYGFFGGWILIDRLEVKGIEMAEGEAQAPKWPALPYGLAIFHFDVNGKYDGNLLIHPFGGDFSGGVKVGEKLSLVVEGESESRDVFVSIQAELAHALEDVGVEVTALEANAFGRLDTWAAILSKKPAQSEQQLLGDIWVAFRAEGDTLPAALVGNYGFAQGVFIIDGDRTVRLKPLVGQGQGFQLKGEAIANLDGDIERAELLVTLPRLARLNPNLEGRIELKTTATGNFLRPELKMEVSGEELTAYGLPIKEPGGTLTLSGWTRGTAALQGVVNSLTITADATFAYLDECWEVSTFAVDAGASNLHGNFTYCETITRGQIEGNIAQLAEWSPLFDLDLEGSAQFTATLGEQMHIEGTSPYLIFDRYRLTDVNASFAAGKLSATAAELRYGDVQFDTLVLETEDHRFSATWQGPETNMEAGGTWKPWTLETFEGTLLGEPVLLKEPLQEPYHLVLDVGSGSIDAKRGDEIDVNVRRFPLHMVEFVLPDYPMTGTLNGDLHLTKTDGNLSVRWQGVEMQDTLIADLGKIDGRLVATFAKGRVNADLETDGVTVTLNAPLHLEDGFSSEGPVSGSAEFSGKLAPLLQFVLPDTVQIDGSMSANLTLSGTVEEPHVEGTLNIENASLEDFYSGAYLRNLNATFVAEGDEVTLKSLTANDGSGGTLTGSGQISVEGDFPFRIDLDARSLLLVNLDVASGRISGPIMLHGTLADPKLSGNLTADSVLINIDKDLPGTVPTLNVTYINIPLAEKQPESLELVPIALDLNLRVPDQGRVIGQGIDSLWKGEIHLTGTADRPLLGGGFGLVKGTFEMAGKSFKLTDGKITWDGPPEDTTKLDIVGTLKVSGATINANLKGTLPNLALTLYSTPPMSDTEILSYMLFGGPTEGLSASQGIQLVQLSTDVSEGEFGRDPFTEIQKGLGLDRFAISTGERGDSRQIGIAATKQFHRNLSVSAFRTLNRTASPHAETPGRATESPSHTSMTIQVFREFRLGVEFISEAGNRFIFVWQKDY